ncbi:hypothetical protein Tco_1466782 [Tanacetum coccineum]
MTDKINVHETKEEARQAEFVWNLEAKDDAKERYQKRNGHRIDGPIGASSTMAERQAENKRKSENTPKQSESTTSAKQERLNTGGYNLLDQL